VDIDRQAIEKRDFPVARRGYDTAAVDAHLRAVAAEFEQLQAVVVAGVEPSLASSAATQVQSILSAAETSAADIERRALEGAAEARERAGQDAERTREDAVSQARAHVAAVAESTAVLLERVSSLDDEVNGLLESVRAGATRLAADLAAVETNMRELYDAAEGRSTAGSADAESSVAAPAAEASPTAPGSAPRTPAAPAPEAPPLKVSSSAPVAAEPVPPAAAAAVASTLAQADAAAPAGANGDLDGARLIALNMALNGESRADADRYLAENFSLSDRGKLIDEVYAAIEG
jgi:DivIVA domain-containing protein